MKHHPNQPSHCQNCGSPVADNFCSHCGQKTHLHREHFGHMVAHFVADYFHYDNKFFKTIKYLITRPGYLTIQYREGKRASYINPIQLYIFISAVFFIVFFGNTHVTLEQHGKRIKGGIAIGKVKEPDDHSFLMPPSCSELQTGYDTIMAYRADLDSIMKHADNKVSFSYLNASLNLKACNYALKHHIYSITEMAELVMEKFVHNLPKVFFVLMPWFALLLLLFFRSGKFLYADHAIFSLHFHTFCFLTFMAGILSGTLIPAAGWYLSLLFIIIIPVVYFFIAARKFYCKNWGYTIILGLLAGVIYIVTFYLSLHAYNMITLSMNS